MIRFVEISKDDDVIPDGAGFAFFNTVPDLFIMIDQQHVFASVEDFLEAYECEEGQKPDLNRLMRLIPDEWKNFKENKEKADVGMGA